MHLAQYAPVSVWNHTTVSEGQSRRLALNNERSLLLVSAEKGAGRFLEIKTERDDILLLLNDFNVFKKIWNARCLNKTLFRRSR